jgi:hypothetical protein
MVKSNFYTWESFKVCLENFKWIYPFGLNYRLSSCFRKEILNVIFEEDWGHFPRDPLHMADEVAPLWEVMRRQRGVRWCLITQWVMQSSLHPDEAKHKSLHSTS